MFQWITRWEYLELIAEAHPHFVIQRYRFGGVGRPPCFNLRATRGTDFPGERRLLGPACVGEPAVSRGASSWCAVKRSREDSLGIYKEGPLLLWAYFNISLISLRSLRRYHNPKIVSSPDSSLTERHFKAHTSTKYFSIIPL